jgi:hypothetical protein
VATLSANEGSMIKTVIIRSFINILFKSELLLSFSEDVKITKTPIIPKAIEEYINNLVAIFCIVLV